LRVKLKKNYPEVISRLAKINLLARLNHSAWLWILDKNVLAFDTTLLAFRGNPTSIKVITNEVAHTVSFSAPSFSTSLIVLSEIQRTLDKFFV